MTRAEFTSDKGRRDHLARIISDPVFKAAVDTFFFEEVPGVSSVAEINNTVGANQLQQLMGVKHFVRRLGDYAGTNPVARKVLPDQLYTEADREALKTQLT